MILKSKYINIGVCHFSTLTIKSQQKENICNYLHEYCSFVPKHRYSNSIAVTFGGTLKYVKFSSIKDLNVMNEIIY